MKVEDVVCSFCGCLCDDLVVEVEENRVINVENGCTLANEKFMGDHRLKNPIRREGGHWKDVSYDAAIQETAEILLDADRPLLYGWSGTFGEAQSVGVHLAELLGAVIDNTSTVCHGPSIMAIQEVGHPGCTLGQVKNRADVIVYWGANPIDAHPRHMSRYTTYADGFFVKEAFKERKVIVVDVRKTESSAVADEFVKVERGGDYAVLSALRAIVRGKRDLIPPKIAGVTREQLFRVADICMNAKFGAIFFGLGLTMSPGKYKNVRNAIELTEELNRHTKFTISPMRGHWNVYGSNEVFTWITGYPYAVDFARGSHSTTRARRPVWTSSNGASVMPAWWWQAIRELISPGHAPSTSPASLRSRSIRTSMRPPTWPCSRYRLPSPALMQKGRHTGWTGCLSGHGNSLIAPIRATSIFSGRSMSG